MKEKYKRREIYIQDKQWESIRNISQKKGVTMSEIIRSAVSKVYPNGTK